MTGRDSKLSPREAECLRLVGKLATSKEIALQLGLTPGSVDVFIKRGMAKLGAPDRRTAARMLADRDPVPDIGAPGITRLPIGQADPAEDAAAVLDQARHVREDRPPFIGGGSPPPQRRGFRNDLPHRARLKLIAIYGLTTIAIFSALILALLVAGVAFRQFSPAQIDRPSKP